MPVREIARRGRLIARMANLPVVLAHGIFRFDELRRRLQDQGGPDLGPHYFVGIKPYLEANGFVVLESDVSFVGSVQHRARQLAAQVQPFAAQQGGTVQIIAHSMGGLDARHAIVHEGLAGCVATLTTIATPHLGSPVAELTDTFSGRLLLAALSTLLDVQGFADLRPDACAARTAALAAHEAVNGVRYRAVHAVESVERMNVLLQTTQALMTGQSDGMVPIRSQQWASAVGMKRIEQLAFPVPADHLNEIGIYDPGELAFGFTAATYTQAVKDFYLALARSA